jgi:hypothetical protein
MEQLLLHAEGKRCAQARKAIRFLLWLAESSRLACRVFAATLPMAHLARRACLLLPLGSPLHHAPAVFPKLT